MRLCLFVVGRQRRFIDRFGLPTDGTWGSISDKPLTDRRARCPRRVGGKDFVKRTAYRRSPPRRGSLLISGKLPIPARFTPSASLRSAGNLGLLLPLKSTQNKSHPAKPDTICFPKGETLHFPRRGKLHVPGIAGNHHCRINSGAGGTLSWITRTPSSPPRLPSP